jgi:hypothetical protein
LKKKYQFIPGAIILLIACALNSNAQHSSKGMLSIEFNNYVDDLILKLDSTVYKNELGQTYTVTNFKYYISNIHLLRSDGKDFISTDHFLINEDEENSKNINLNSIPEGEYNSISFIVGVDSLHNCNGAQSGALDPVNGMFWAWNTGYIFLKLEGRSSASTSPGNILEYHIGGYKQPSNCIRTITLKFEQAKKIHNNETAAINIKTNVAEILKTPSTINFGELSAVTDFHNATTIADNFKDMFTIIEVK